MPGLIRRCVAKVVRVVSLVAFALLGTIALVRYAPGYFSDAREMDAQHASNVRVELAIRQVKDASFVSTVGGLVIQWCHGDLGVSRHFEIPVSKLLRERVGSSARLLGKAIVLGWLLSLCIALPLSAQKSHLLKATTTLLSSALLCIPTALLATVCLVANVGGPVIVLATLVATRDFKLLYRMLHGAMRSSSVLYARSQGISFANIVRMHLFRSLSAELTALLMASLVVGLSAVVPVEVIFDQPGVGQLAWSAAMNRDLPTLLAVTAVMAGLIGVVSVFVDSKARSGVSACA